MAADHHEFIQACRRDPDRVRSMLAVAPNLALARGPAGETPVGAAAQGQVDLIGWLEQMEGTCG